MKKSILLSSLFTLALLGSQQVFAVTDSQDGKEQESKQEKPISPEKTDGLDIDSTTFANQVIIDSESPEQERRIAPDKPVVQQPGPQNQEPPAEDQSKSTVSSFNLFYYLIEKIKFPDLLDESF